MQPNSARPALQFRDVTKNAIYINLDSRIDRRKLFEKQINDLHTVYPGEYLFHNALRFPAIKNEENGALGCSKSQAECIRIAKRNNWEYVVIFEDDAEILHPAVLSAQVNSFLAKHRDNWDVILLSGNNYPPFKIEGPECFRVLNCNCCTSYIVKREYYDTLLQNFEEGIALFERFPADKPRYACDIYWKRLQYKDRWFLITPICISQRPDYSDIEKCFVNYNDLILNLVKNKNKIKSKQL